MNVFAIRRSTVAYLLAGICITVLADFLLGGFEVGDIPFYFGALSVFAIFMAFFIWDTNALNAQKKDRA